MKRIFALIVLLSCTMSAIADTKSDKILSQMSSKIAGMGTYEVKIEVRVDGDASQAEFVVSGDMYYMDFRGISDVVVICDGGVRYEINSQYKEVMISNTDPKNEGFFANPTKIFNFTSGEFTHQYKESRVVGGKECDVVSMQSTAKGSDFSNVELVVDSKSGLPVMLVYQSRSMEEKIEVVVTKFASAPQTLKSIFQFDRKKYKDYELVDFR